MIFPGDEIVRGCIENIEEEKYRLAFMYQYLIAGKISEVCGVYSPKGSDAHEMEIAGEPAVLFEIRSARHQGKNRGCALPLDTQYEPWAAPLLEYFREHETSSPFHIHKNEMTAKRYYQWEAKKVFSGLWWPAIDYKQVLHRVGWTKKLREISDDLVQANFEYPQNPKPFTSIAIPKLRKRTLVKEHGFNRVDLKAYADWSDGELDFLSDVASIYFNKLLVAPC